MKNNFETYYDGVFNGLDLAKFIIESFKELGVTYVNIDDVLNIIESSMENTKLNQKEEREKMIRKNRYEDMEDE